MSQQNFFVCGPKFTNFLSPNVEGVVVDDVFFQMFDMSISSGDIRDQSRKLSKIGPKYGRFLALPNFWGRAFQKLYARYNPYLGSRRLEKFREDTPTSPEVIEAHTLNFKPNFKFSRLKFFLGDPRPSLGVPWVALVNL